MDKLSQAHATWLESHIQKRSGERKRRLEDGHNHAEKELVKKIWLPAFGHLKYLHPEYEVKDFLEGRRYLDFAYIRFPYRIVIEVDGFGPHWRDISRRQFCDERVRTMHLINDGWIVIRISFDDIIERPKIWQQLLQQMMGRLFGDSDAQAGPLYNQAREVVKLAIRLERPIKLSDIRDYFRCGYRAARGLIKDMEEKQIFVPEGGGCVRTHSWTLNANQASIYTA